MACVGRGQRRRPGIICGDDFRVPLLPVTVTHLRATRARSATAQSVSYRPGSLNEVLTEHFRRASLGVRHPVPVTPESARLLVLLHASAIGPVPAAIEITVSDRARHEERWPSHCFGRPPADAGDDAHERVIRMRSAGSAIVRQPMSRQGSAFVYLHLDVLYWPDRDLQADFQRGYEVGEEFCERAF
jgi:hypothetical protein